MKMDWTRATKDQKKILFDYAQGVAIARGLKWPEFTSAVFARSFAANDVDNCRAGRMGVARCIILAKWLHENEPDLATELDVKIGAANFPRAEVWQTSLHKAPDGVTEARYTLLKTIVFEPNGQRIIPGTGEPSRIERGVKFEDVFKNPNFVTFHSLDDEPGER